MTEPARTKGRILIAGPDRQATAALSEILTQAGHQVHIAEPGVPLRPPDSDRAPDLILLQPPPASEGLDLLRQWKQQATPQPIPILLVWDRTALQDPAPAFAAGATDLVYTPLAKEEILARVETYLSLAGSQRQLSEALTQLEQEMALRLQAEATVHEAEQSGQSLVDTLSEIIYTADQDGMLTYASPAVKRFLGFNPAEVIGRPISDLVHEEDRARLQADLDHMMQGHPSVSQYRLVTKSGEVRWVRTSSQTISAAGRVIGFQGVLSDITEQRQAAQQIEQQNAFLTNVLESLTHPFYVINASNYTLEIANTAARREGRAGASTCYALTHNRSRPCDSADHPCPLDRIKVSRKPVTVQHLHYNAQGERRHVEVHGYPLFDEHGGVSRVIEYTLDVTEQRQAEEALRKSEALLRETQQMAKVGGWELDLDSAQLLWTDEVLRIHDVPPGYEPSLAAALSFYHPADRPLLQAAIEAAVDTGHPWDLELRFTTATGNPLWVRAIGKAEFKDGRPVRLSGTFQDITERKRAEDALRESEARWRSVTENSPDHVILLDTDLNIQFVNYPSPGLTVSQLIGTPLHAYVQEEHRDEIQRILQRVLETGVPASYETEYTAPGEETIYYESRVVRRLLDDTVLGLAVNARDITAYKLGEQAQREAIAAAERNRLARDLHDSVTQALFSASLVAEVLPQVWRRDPHEAQEGLDELRALTRGALAEMRTLLLELRPSALTETRLDDLLRQLAEAITSRAHLEASLDLEPVPTLPSEVHVTFYRVAQEALHNVVKHAGARHVTVSLRASPALASREPANWRGQVVLHIRDDGRGFDPEDTTPDQLGLAIMRERAESVGALLSLQSQPGHNTQITLVWQRR